jgi:hypothetical protein
MTKIHLIRELLLSAQKLEDELTYKSPLMFKYINDSWGNNYMLFQKQQLKFIKLNIEILNVVDQIKWILLLEPCKEFSPSYNFENDIKSVFKLDTLENSKKFMIKHGGLILYSFLKNNEFNNDLDDKYLIRMYLPFINQCLAIFIRDSLDSTIMAMNLETIEFLSQVYRRVTKFKLYSLKRLN